MDRDSLRPSSEIKTAILTVPALVVTGLGYAAYYGFDKAREYIQGIKKSDSQIEHTIYAADGGVAPGALMQTGDK